jgi:hypothetical protein
MPKVKDELIAVWAAQAGFTAANLQTMVAVCLAESGGNTDAHNTRGEDSRGLGQINVAPGANPDLANMNLFDGPTNLRACKTVHDRQGFKAWTMFKNGQFLLYMPRAGLAISRARGLTPAQVDALAGAVSRSPAGQAIGDVGKAVGNVVDVGGAVQNLANLSAKAGTFIVNPRNWIRIVYVGIGAALIVAALTIVARPVVEPAVKAVADIAV